MAAASASASTLVALRTRIASTSAMRRQQLGAVGAVAGADLEVGPERLDGGGAELFGDEDDGLAHGAVLGFGSVARWRPRPLVKPVEGDAVHDVVPVPGLYPIDAPTCRSRRATEQRRGLPRQGRSVAAIHRGRR